MRMKVGCLEVTHPRDTDLRNLNLGHQRKAPEVDGMDRLPDIAWRP